MKEFEPLIGEWHGEGEFPVEPPMKISVEAKIERLGEFIVFSTVAEPAEVPDSVASSTARPTASRSRSTTSILAASSGCT